MTGGKQSYYNIVVAIINVVVDLMDKGNSRKKCIEEGCNLHVLLH